MGHLKQLQPGRWCGTLAGRAIAIAQVAGVWLVYIDHVLQGNARFQTAERAYQWACSRITMTAASPLRPRQSLALAHPRRGWARAAFDATRQLDDRELS